MDIRITPGPLKGTVTPPPSKSMTHRALIAAALTEGDMALRGPAQSRDIQATAACLAAMGADLTPLNGGDLRVCGLGNSIPRRRPSRMTRFDCGESGSTLRFLIPAALAVRGGGTFTGGGRLMERPLQPYFDIFEEKGVFYEQKDGVLTVRGKLTPGAYRLPGNVSSQFVTGLLFALPLLEGNSAIVMTSPLESRSYVNMTLKTLKDFGVAAENMNYELFLIPGGQRFQARDCAIEADWSQAAFWYAALFLGSPVRTVGLNNRSVQGDAVIKDWIGRLSKSGTVEIDVSDCPDLVPPLAAMAALRDGHTTYMGNAARLRLKESDRLSSVTQVLSAMGARMEEGPDFLKITGRNGLEGGVTADCRGDHRIAMMAAVAATRCGGPVTLLGADCVDKSYPTFWEEYRRLGGIFDVL